MPLDRNSEPTFAGQSGSVGDAASGSERVRLAGHEARHLPFPHFTAREVFDQHFAHALLCWLARCDYWVLSRQSFYEHYEFELAQNPLSGPAVLLTSPDVLGQLTSLCERHFSEKLCSGVSVTAHKLVSGHHIGVHTDAPSKKYGMETHRLVVQLNHGQGLLSGGNLQLFSHPKAPAPDCEYDPRHNSGFGFKLTPQSYHAVGPVWSGERYSLIFTFRSIEGSTDREILDGLPPEYRRRLFIVNRTSGDGIGT
jgi:hypothetical protein